MLRYFVEPGFSGRICGGQQKGPVAGLYLWREVRGGGQKGENRSAHAQKLDGGQMFQFFGQAKRFGQGRARAAYRPCPAIHTAGWSRLAWPRRRPFRSSGRQGRGEAGGARHTFASKSGRRKNSSIPWPSFSRRRLRASRRRGCVYNVLPHCGLRCKWRCMPDSVDAGPFTTQNRNAEQYCIRTRAPVAWPSLKRRPELKRFYASRSGKRYWRARLPCPPGDAVAGSKRGGARRLYSAGGLARSAAGWNIWLSKSSFGMR